MQTFDGVRVVCIVKVRIGFYVREEFITRAYAFNDIDSREREREKQKERMKFQVRQK